MFTLQFALALGILLVLLFFMTGPFFPVVVAALPTVLAVIFGALIVLAGGAFALVGAGVGLGVLEQLPVIGDFVTAFLGMFSSIFGG